MQAMKEGKWDWNILSIYRSQIMGIAIIWIMLMHGLQLFPDMLKSVPPISFVLNRGMIGVEMFLLVSGIGLYYSFSRQGNVKAFYIRRAKRVLIPYLVISFPFWIWQDIYIRHNVMDFIQDFSLISFWTDGIKKVWYIALIIPLYVLYPFLFNVFLKKGTGLRKGILMLSGFCIPAFIFMINPSYFTSTEIAWWRISSFILGNILAVWVMKSEKITLVHVFLLGGITIVFAAGVLWGERIADIPGLFRVAYIPLGLICCLLSGIVLKVINNKLLNRLLGAAGKYSLELYIIHLFLRTIYRHYAPASMGENPMLAFLIWLSIMLVSVILSMGAHAFLFHKKTTIK